MPDSLPLSTRDPSGTLIIHGKNVATRLRQRLKVEIEKLKVDYKLTPGLAVIIVGEDPASLIYVSNKRKSVLEVGMHSVEKRLPQSTTQDDLIKAVRLLNNDPAVHGILVQSPLPSHINPNAVFETIDPAKDVDGFHAINAGKLALGLPALIPCTPKGSINLLKMLRADLSGLNALVIGRSILVGKPMAQLLLAENCTVTMAHSRTKNLAEECARADIVVAAIGRPEIIKGEWLKKDAIVLDVGINRVDRDGTSKIVGDVDFKSALGIASAITPVPGGIGPMTIASLLDNTLKAACWATNVPRPVIQLDHDPAL